MAHTTLNLPPVIAYPAYPTGRRSALALPRPSARARWVGLQVLVMIAAVGAYFGVRGATEAKAPEALRNAAGLVRVEQLLGLDREAAIQAAMLPHGWVSAVFGRIYIFGHWPVIALTLVLLAVHAPAVFSRTRNAILLSGSAGLLVFLTLPVAPPRLAGMGLVDTVDQQSHAYRVLQPAAFTNQYAALPSLHVGWNLLMGLALWAATRRWWLRVLAVAGPLTMATAVVVTANHYLVDVLAGASLATAAWLVAGRLATRRSTRVTEAAGTAGAAGNAERVVQLSSSTPASLSMD